MPIFILLFIFLAYLGVSSLVGSAASSQAAPAMDRPAPTETSDLGVSRWLANSAMAAASAAGLELVPLAQSNSGCSPSLLSPAKVDELLQALPAPQRAALSKIVEASSTVWLAQLYSGPRGTGLCLPDQGLVVVIRGLDVQLPEAVTDLIPHQL